MNTTEGIPFFPKNFQRKWPFSKSDHYINSSNNFNTLSSKQVMRIKISTRGYCLDITLNAKD